MLQDASKFASTIKDWLGEGCQPDPQAQDRANICTGKNSGRPCEFNWRGGWIMRREVADTVRRWIEAKEHLQLRVEGEDQLGTCEVCRCPLSTKIHIPLKTILAHTPKEEFENLPPHCWIKLETDEKIPLLARLIPCRNNATAFNWTGKAIQEAFDANQALGSLWSEDEIVCNWCLARSLVIAGMKASGITEPKIAKRIGVSVTRISQILSKLEWERSKKWKKTQSSSDET
jgi:hypothetical protein